jgi:divalent metal cation (Fe/Co/Zn/Cd) transporter
MTATGNPVEFSPGPSRRQAAVGRAVLLNRLTIGYNALEAVVALAAGLLAGSISLIGFGIDSSIEVSAALVLAWRLAAERRDGCTQETDNRATRLVAVSFAALAAFVGYEAVTGLVASHRPDASIPGIALAATSLVVMPVIAHQKRQVAGVLGSQAQAAEAKQTQLCAYLSAVVLVGLAANAVLGWWWADPVAAIVVAALAAVEAVRTWRADSLEDTCCG